MKNTKYEKMNFAELSKLKSGTILADWFDGGIRILILRGPAALTCYLGISENHPLAGFDYDSLSFISAHGGLTFGGRGKKDTLWPEGFYWYGWDYGHCEDKSFFGSSWEENEKEWTVEEVKKDLADTLFEFKQVAILAEKIYMKK